MLTVLIATRNGEKTLPEVLEAYCRLDPPKGNWRLIVIDNGSTDDTKTVVMSFLSRLPLAYMFEATPGKNAALNTGLSKVEGNLVVFSDDDSVPQKDWLVQIRAMCDANPAFSIFAGKVIPRWQKTPSDWILNWVPLDCTFTVSDPELREGPIAYFHVFGPNMAIRREVFDAGYRFSVKIGPCGKSYPMGSETEFVRRLVHAGLRCWYSPNPVVEHIIDPDHLERAWILRRAMLFGRGNIRLNLKNNQNDQSWFGVPQYLIIQLLKRSFRVLYSVVTGDQREVFQARWDLSFCKGQVLEARQLRDERLYISD
jgi:glycosyltransferase involved in cell wall biosynthesis